MITRRLPKAAAARLARAAASAVIAAAVLLAPTPATAQEPPPLPDAIPTAWHRQVNAEALLTAPPPPNPVTICVVDTGVTPTPDLTITARYAYDGGTLDDVTAKPGHPGHGTTVAHFAAAAVNGWGGAGIFPHARIASVRVFPEEGGAAWQDYITAFDRCERLDPATKVILMSLGGQEIEPREAEELEDRIHLAHRLDNRNVVVAAGNTGGMPDYPGRFASALTVSGLDGAEGLCPMAARGVEVDLVAPGCALTHNGWSGEVFDLEGTSFAAPMVAGALAALRSYAPHLSWEEAEQVLLDGHGGQTATLDVGQVLAAARIMPPTLPPPPVEGRSLFGAVAPNRADAITVTRRPQVRLLRRPSRWLLRVFNGRQGERIAVRIGQRTLIRRTAIFEIRPGRHKRAFVRFSGPKRLTPWTTVNLRRPEL